MVAVAEAGMPEGQTEKTPKAVSVLRRAEEVSGRIHGLRGKVKGMVDEMVGSSNEDAEVEASRSGSGILGTIEDMLCNMDEEITLIHKELSRL